MLVDGVAEPEVLEEIERTLDRFWGEHPAVPETTRMYLGIAVAEIGANIIEHSGRHRRVRLRMELRHSPGEVRVNFTDDGPPVEVDLDSLPEPDDLAERGRGLALAKAALSSLSYHRDERGNHWLLVSRPF